MNHLIRIVERSKEGGPTLIVTVVVQALGRCSIAAVGDCKEELCL